MFSIWSCGDRVRPIFHLGFNFYVGSNFCEPIFANDACGKMFALSLVSRLCAESTNQQSIDVHVVSSFSSHPQPCAWLHNVNWEIQLQLIKMSLILCCSFASHPRSCSLAINPSMCSWIEFDATTIYSDKSCTQSNCATFSCWHNGNRKQLGNENYEGTQRGGGGGGQ